MTGAAAKKRHEKARSERSSLLKDHKYRDEEGEWHDRPAFHRRTAQRAVERIYEMTGAEYVKYECRNCGEWHIKPHGKRWRASLLVQMLDEGIFQ